MSNRFEAIGPFVYEKGNRIGVTPDDASVELARKLNAYQMRVERFKAEVDRLRKAGDAMASSIQFNEEMDQDYNGPTIVHQCVQRWNAAKEGKDQP